VPRSSRGERGQIIVVFLLATVAIVAAVGLVIDGGFAFAQRRAEQNAADLAAFAGANALLNGQDATTAALASATQNRFEHGTNGVAVTVAVTPKTVKVDITAPHANYFAGVVGQSSWDISVTATALTGIPTAFLGVAPFILSQEIFDPVTGLPYVDFTTDYDFTKTTGSGSDAPIEFDNMAWTNLGIGNVSSDDVKDALDGTAPINASLILNQYIGQHNNGVHNSLFDSNGNQPSVNTTLAGLDVAVPIVGPPIDGEDFCFNAAGTSDGTNTAGCFRGWALFHVVSATKNGLGEDGRITGYFLTGISRSASVDSVCAVSDTSCADLFHGVYVIKLID
jgi:Flp pilus assembly protein TadG